MTGTSASSPLKEPFHSVATKMQTILNGACQLLAMSLAVLFGVYTMLSFYAAKAAYQQSLVANQIALLAYCRSAEVSVYWWLMSFRRCSWVLF